MGGWLGRSLDTVPSAEDEDFQGSDSNDNLLSGDPLGTSPDPATQPLSSESLEVTATTDLATPELLFLLCVFSFFPPLSFPSINLEEFLRADTGTGWAVKFGVRNSVIRFLPNQIGNVRTPLPPPARLVRMVKRRQEERGSRQESARRRRRTSRLCPVSR